jgi:hypothetical protein
MILQYSFTQLILYLYFPDKGNYLEFERSISELSSFRAPAGLAGGAGLESLFF